MKIKFEEERYKKQNIKILSHLNKINDLTLEEIDQLKLIVLWRSIESFNEEKGCKFTTHLYNTCRFTYLKHINKRKELFCEPQENYYIASIDDSLLDELPVLYKTVLKDRYIYRYSILEMVQKYKMKKWQISVLIEDSKNYLKKQLTN